MRMKPVCESDWHEVCGNCKFFDGTQTHTHCCDLHIHSKLMGGPCFDFLYDCDHYGAEYGCDKLSEDYIKSITIGYTSSPEIRLDGEDLGYNAVFDAYLDDAGNVSIWSEHEYGVRLDKKSMRLLIAILEEGLRRKKCD